MMAPKSAPLTMSPRLHVQRHTASSEAKFSEINTATVRCYERGHVVLLTEIEAMFIFSTVADTLAQRFTKEHVREDPKATASIRRAMLELLPPEGSGFEIDRFRHRLLVASNATSLWFLRVNLHQHLTHSLGEQSAMQQVHALRHLFDSVLPASLLGPKTHRRGLHP